MCVPCSSEWQTIVIYISEYYINRRDLLLFHFRFQKHGGYNLKTSCIIQGERETSAILFNSRRGRLKGPKKLYTIRGLNLIVFSEKRCFWFCFVHVVLLISLRDNAKKNYVSRLIFEGVILFSKIFFVFHVVYVKSNIISCEFSGLNYVATL